jgi:hypothetical protein
MQVYRTGLSVVSLLYILFAAWSLRRTFGEVKHAGPDMFLYLDIKPNNGAYRAVTE